MPLIKRLERLFFDRSQSRDCNPEQVRLPFAGFSLQVGRPAA